MIIIKITHLSIAKWAIIKISLNFMYKFVTFFYFVTFLFLSFNSFSMEQSKIESLFLAIKKKNREKVQEILKSGVNINLELFNQTALMKACDIGDAEIVQLLVDYPGININFQNFIGTSALTFASYCDHIEVLKILLDQPNIKLNQSSTDVDQTLPGITAIFKAALQKNYISVKLLAAAGADIAKIKQSEAIEAAKDGQEICEQIFQAGSNGDINQIKNFVKSGFSLNARDFLNNTPLHYAVVFNDKCMIITLLGYNPKLICSKNNHNLTPIELALESDEWGVITLFLNLAYIS